MSLYVVEREDPFAAYFDVGLMGLDFRYQRYACPVVVPEVRDCNERDGEWHAVVTLPHEIVEYEGRAVPAFEGDAERIAWERARRAP